MWSGSDSASCERPCCEPSSMAVEHVTQCTKLYGAILETTAAALVVRQRTFVLMVFNWMFLCQAGVLGLRVDGDLR